jgi:hypothetical protein
MNFIYDEYPQNLDVIETEINRHECRECGEALSSSPTGFCDDSNCPSEYETVKVDSGEYDTEYQIPTKFEKRPFWHCAKCGSDVDFDGSAL